MSKMYNFLMGYRVLYKVLCGTEMIGRLSDSMSSQQNSELSCKAKHMTLL